MADVLAVSKTVLNEEDFVSGQKVKVATPVASDFLDLEAMAAHVSPMPEHGRKGVRVTDENAIGLAGCCIFAASLFPGLDLRTTKAPACGFTEAYLCS